MLCSNSVLSVGFMYISDSSSHLSLMKMVVSRKCTDVSEYS